MANDRNLKGFNTKTREEMIEIGKKGAKASAEAKRQKKLVREILQDLMNSPITDYPVFEKAAQKIGVDHKKTVKELFTMACVMNNVKDAKLKDLDTLVNLLGEETVNNNNGVLEDLRDCLRGAVK